MPELTTPTPEQVLATPMPDNDAGAATIRDYLIRLLTTLWEDEAAFNPASPFSGDGWQYDVYGALIRAGHITGFVNEDGYVADCDDAAGDALILAAIRHLGGTNG